MREFRCPPAGGEGLEGFTDSINTIQQDKRFPKRIKKKNKEGIPSAATGGFPSVYSAPERNQ